jgi:ABC-type glycerol-3-phosphate transport system permease component
VQGELKTKAVPLVKGLYDFKMTNSNKSIIQANHEHQENLKDNANCIYKVRNVSDVLYPYNIIHLQDLHSQSGICEHPIIQELLNAMWLANSHDEGITYASYFRSAMNSITMALILTIVQIHLSVSHICADHLSTNSG